MVGAKSKKGDADHKLCALPREGEDKCMKSTHKGNNVNRGSGCREDCSYQLSIRVPIVSDTNRMFFSRPAIQKEDLMHAHGLDEHALSHICQLEARAIVWKILFEHCYCREDSAAMTEMFLLKVKEMIPEVGLDGEEEMKVDAEDEQGQQKRDKPSTPVHKPAGIDESKSPLPAQRNKRQYTGASNMEVDPPKKSSTFADVLKESGNVPPKPIQSPSHPANETGPCLEPLNKQSTSSAGRSLNEPSEMTPAPRNRTSFQPGTDLNNSGNTNKARAAARAAKGAGTPAPSKKAFPDNKTFMQFSLVVKGGTGMSTRDQVLTAVASSLRLMQEDEKTCTLGHLYDSTMEPLDGTKWPAKHKQLKRYVYCGGSEWQVDEVADGESRRINGKILLYSDLTAEELLEENGVDIREFMELSIKEFQSMKTVNDLTLLLAPNDIGLEPAADTIWQMLSDAEATMIGKKKANERMHPDTLVWWEQSPFPRFLASRRYPRGGKWVPRKKGAVKVDTTHKMAIHFEFEQQRENRIMAALHYCTRNKIHKLFFGDFATLVFPP